jgi:hypothetical protein
MLVLHRRLAIAGVITATAIAVPAAALASGPGSPSGKPAPPQASAVGASKSAAAPSASKSAAAPSQLTKQAQPDWPPAPVGAFATRLGVSTSAAGRAFKQIAALSSKNGVDPASSAFAAIAHELGVSPAQLAAAWDAVKQSVTGK